MTKRGIPWFAAAVSVLLSGGCATAPSVAPTSNVDTRIGFYVDKLAQHPRLHAGYALLAMAYLDKTRETLDPSFLTDARSALERSIAIQPNFQALKTMAVLYNFTHRFEDALDWGKRAAAASPADTAVTALLVEAYMGLGRYEEAARALPSDANKPGDFYAAAALGQWLTSQRRYDEAADAFQLAAGFARVEAVTDLVVWAGVSSAGAFLDWGRPGPARSHLRAVSNLRVRSPVIWKEQRLHWGELHEAEGDLEKALAVYESLLERWDDPEIHRKAFLICRWHRQSGCAQQHFKAAEKGFQRIIDAGEIYTLGPLARLYAEAGINMDLALALAERNLTYKRDVEADATLDYVRSKHWLSR